jgi:hypothetical protein
LMTKEDTPPSTKQASFIQWIMFRQLKTFLFNFTHRFQPSNIPRHQNSCYNHMKQIGTLSEEHSITNPKNSNFLDII